MTYTPTKTQKSYKSYPEYLDDEGLYSEAEHRLLSTGEVVVVASEDELNKIIAYALMEALLTVKGIPFLKFIRTGDEELQVHPEGDRWVNRKPDLLVMQPEHVTAGRKAILFDMPAPAFVAEVVSPGSETSNSYKRDYIWKRKQYEWWQIPEYWIIDPHRQQVTVLTLDNKVYQEKVFIGEENITSKIFPDLVLTVSTLLKGSV